MNKIHPIHRPRHGFSLIELLAVIAIIVILVGIVFVGMKYVTGTASAKSTQTTLANLQSMLSALDIQSRGALDQIDSAYALYQTTYSVNVHPIVLPTITSNDAGVMEPKDPATPPAANTHRYDPFVQITGTIAMQKILTLPENKAALGKLSTKMLPTWSTALWPQTNILLDDWNNPIIYVPSGGLKGVTFTSTGTATLKIVTSTGVHDTTYVATSFDRPFFASAGPDGDFTKGDDNIYSFEH